LVSFRRTRPRLRPGFSKLKAEKSTNFSLGFVAHPLPKLQITVDAYQIKIRDRIVPSGSIYGTLGSTTVSQAVVDALISRGVSLAEATSYSGMNIFTNGVDTRTRGVEATASYASDFGEMGKVDWSLGVNYNKTDVTRISSLPASVYNAARPDRPADPNAVDALTTATPRVKLIAGACGTSASSRSTCVKRCMAPPASTSAPAVRACAPRPPAIVPVDQDRHHLHHRPERWL
jgi:iron complex outermembrane receptor protein